MNRLSLPVDLPCVRFPNTGDTFHQYGLTGTVITYECSHLARRNVQLNVEQGLHRTEALADTTQTQQWVRRHHALPIYTRAPDGHGAVHRAPAVPLPRS